MKKITTFIIASIVALSANAQQQHYCAKQKASHFNKKYSSSLPVGYIPPESNYDLKFYHLNLNVERNSLLISGNVLSKALVVVPALDTFAFVLHINHTIDSIYVNGAKRNFVRQDSLVKATTGLPIVQNTLFDAIVYYHGICPQGGGAAIGDGYNMATSPSWGNEVTWSLSESFVAYQWFPCKQDLTDKIDSSWVFATTDTANMVGSNGLLKNIVPLGAKKRFEWKSKYPIDYYLISVSTAKYRQYNMYAKPQYLAPDSILIQNFVYDNALYNPNWNTQKIALNKIKQTIELQSNLYGMYPFYKEKYGHCMAPLGGGMEHQTMTTLGFFEFSIDAHELGHQWWGDHVTCKAWKDIFINEAWASYTEQLCDEYLPTISGNTATNNMQTVHNNVMSLPGGSCYFTNADTMNSAIIFDSRLTYDKGSAVLHSLRYEINNDSVFFPAIRAFQNTYKHSVASVIDFKNFMSTYTGINFNQFFNQWYYGQGYPTFTVKYAKAGNTFYLKSTQTQSMASITPLFVTHVDYKISRASMPDTIIRMQHGQLVENYTLTLTGTVTAVAVDPKNWILNKVVGPTLDNTIITSVDELQESISIAIGPNPTADMVYVNLNSNEKHSFEIIDITGKSIIKKEFEQHAEFDLSKYSNGMYTVMIKNKQNELVKTSKVVKN